MMMMIIVRVATGQQTKSSAREVTATMNLLLLFLPVEWVAEAGGILGPILLGNAESCESHGYSSMLVSRGR
jgi:hypothetical protein